MCINLFRTCIFSIYQKNSHLPKDVEYLINELKPFVNYFVVVINGELIESDKLEHIVDKVINREKKGFDAGAYKTALNDLEVKDIVVKSDELVFCNDTFYGPFVPFLEIFNKFVDSPIDFWGIRFFDNGLVKMIESFFYVFKKRIITDNFLYDFFKYYNENTTNFNDALLGFERKIFDNLVRAKYTYDYYYKIKYRYLPADIILSKNPILKKKHAFDVDYLSKIGWLQRRDCKGDMLTILQFLYNNKNYDIQMILEDIKNRYSLNITLEDIKNYKNKEIDVTVLETSDTNVVDSVNAFVKNNNSVYLYGMGGYARNVIQNIGIDKVKGFVISDGQDFSNLFEDKPVCYLSEIHDRTIPIIVALGRENTAKVKPLLNGFNNVLYLW